MPFDILLRMLLLPFGKEIVEGGGYLLPFARLDFKGVYELLRRLVT